MKYIYLVFLFLFIAKGSLAQSQFPGAIDSLNQILSTDLSDSSRMMVLEALARAYLWTDNDSAEKEYRHGVRSGFSNRL